MRQLAALLLATCIGPTALAANICNEMVPSDHVIDGIPAYQQCTDSTNSAIYSNNGVDTATTSAGSDWLKTQYSGGYQCTELAHRYLAFKWGIKSVPNGNAGVWCDGTLPAGLAKGTTPAHGDLIVFAPGSCGADSTTGHVAVVDVVNTNGTVTFVEQNRANRRSCAVSTAACFLHATTNGTIDGGIHDAATTDTAMPISDATPASDAPVDRRRDASGTGGRTGSVGADGTGGDIGHGSGGQPGLGGATPAANTNGSGGSGGTTAPLGSEPGAAGNEGCACRIASRRTDGLAQLCLLALAVLAAARRRRR